MSPDDLERKLTERPFQPFRIKLSTSSTIDVQFPGEIVMGLTSTTFPLEVIHDDEGLRIIKTWRGFQHSHGAVVSKRVRGSRVAEILQCGRRCSRVRALEDRRHCRWNVPF